MGDYQFDKNTILLIVPSSLIMVFWFWDRAEALPSGLLDVFIALAMLLIIGMYMNMLFYFISARAYMRIMERYNKLKPFDKSKILTPVDDVHKALVFNSTFFHHLAISIFICIIIGLIMAILASVHNVNPDWYATIFSSLIALFVAIINLAISFHFFKSHEELRIS